MDGWGKIKRAASYAGVSERTMRDWLKAGGLRHSRLPSGTVLIQFKAIDDYLSRFEADASQVDNIVKDVLKGLG